MDRSINYTFPCRSTIHLWIQKASWAPYEWYGVLVWGHWYLRMMTNPTPTILRFWEYQLLFIYKIGENLHFWENILSCACPLPEKQCIFRVFAVCQPVATQFYVTRWSPGYRKYFRPLCFCFFPWAFSTFAKQLPKTHHCHHHHHQLLHHQPFGTSYKTMGISYISYITIGISYISCKTGSHSVQNFTYFLQEEDLTHNDGRMRIIGRISGILCISRSIHLHIPIKAAHPCHHKSS